MRRFLYPAAEDEVLEQVGRAIRQRADLFALVALAGVAPFLPGGIAGIGVVAGASFALQAAGLILVHRSDRIINFAQVQVGVVAAVLFRLLVEHGTLLGGLNAVCDPCVGAETQGLRWFSFVGSLIVGLAAAVALSWIMHAGIVRRFRRAPRLVLTIATIGIAQVLGSLQEGLPFLFATDEQRRLDRIPRGDAVTLPVDASFTWSPVRFHAADVLTVVVAGIALVALALYVRQSRGGIAIRAAADDRARAETLGIDADRMGARVWMIAGALSATAGLLAAMTTPSPEAGVLGTNVIVRIVAVAVIARMTSIPIAAAAGLALGVFDQGMVWFFGQRAVPDALMAVVIGAMLLVQPRSTSRAEQASVDAWRAVDEPRRVPAILRDLPEVVRARRRIVGAGIVAALGLPFVLTPTQTNLTTIALTYAIVGLSLLVLSGWAGQVSLGQFALAAVGAVVVTALPVWFPVALVAATAAGALTAVLVGLPALRLRGLQLAITTLAVAVAVWALLGQELLGGLLPARLERPAFLGVDLNETRTMFYVTLVALAAIAGVVVALRRSRIGRVLIAARDNPDAAQAFGISIVRARLGAFALSGALAALAGALFATHQNGVLQASFTPEISITLFVIAVLGGLGSVAGPVLGAAVLAVLSMTGAGPVISFLATGGGLIALLLVAPGGLAEAATAVRDAYLRRVARKRGIAVPALGVASVERAPLAPASEPGFVPERYRLTEQWGTR